MLLKREIGSESWAMEAIVKAVCKGRGRGSLGRRRSSWIDDELATKCDAGPGRNRSNTAILGVDWGNYNMMK